MWFQDWHLHQSIVLLSFDYPENLFHEHIRNLSVLP